VYVIAVLNRDSGTLRTLDLEAFCTQTKRVFRRRGHSIDCRIIGEAGVEAALREAAATQGVDAIIAAGGDGTISTAATIAFETGVALGVLPAGTMNLFARTLKMPLTLDEALESLANASLAKVDIATANDRPFVHQYSVGIHPRLVSIRNGMTHRSRLGKLFASSRAVLAAVASPPNFVVEVISARSTQPRRVTGVSVSNNPLGDGHIPHADRLDGGVLGLYLAEPISSAALARLIVDVFRGTWRGSPAVQERETPDLVLRFPRRKRGAKAVIDGELIRLEPEIRFQIHPGALNVLLPVADMERTS
jgi:diacylglycerol kinase family enzyme